MGQFNMYRNDVKKVRFFRDGDANFSGVSVAISRTKYRNFDSLLNDLSRRVPLPFGVRTLHTPGGVHHVYDIDEIEDGKDYVCSTFHSRPIKKIDYSRQHSRESWRPAPRKIESQYKSDKQQNESGEKLFHMRNLKPKSITVVAKDDSSNRARVILNRKTAMNYESVLQTISDILQMNNGPVKDLYTLEGKKVGGIADLIHGPDMFLAAARSSGTISARSLPSRLLKKKSNSSSFNSSSKSHAKSAAVTNRKAKDVFAKRSPYTQPVVNRKKEPKIKGNPFVFTVKTSDQENAGTEGSVSVVVCGSKGCTGKLALGPPSSKKFAAGSTEEFEINVGSIGKIQKLRVIHAEHEDETGWHLNEILMTSVARKAEEYSFPCDQWFSNKDEGDVSLIELPAVVKGKEVAEVVNYEVTVVTGDDISAATDSNVFVTIFGENCDTGKRWLKKARDSSEPFAKGAVDVFDIKAVSLKKLKKIVIGHDNSGNTPSWYLEKVLIKDSASEAEYSFPCRRFLDDEEGDGKTEVTIQAVPVFDPSMDTEQLWKSSSWKFKESSEIILTSAVNGNVLRISDEGEVLADQEDAQHSIFTISGGGESRSRVFTAKTNKHDFNLTLDNGTVTGRKGNPGLLSEFFILPLNDGCFALESVVHRGTLVAIAETGKAKPINVDCEQTKFNVHVKGSLRNLGRIRLTRFQKREIIVETGGNLYGDGDNDDERGEFVVHKVGPGTRSFQSAVTDKFICVTSDEINCKGEDKSDPECQFTVHKENRKGFLSLESVKMPGVFLGIGDTGKVKHAVDAGDVTACLSVEITSFGERSKRVDVADEENYIANDDFEDGDSVSGSESGLSNASKHPDADYDDHFEDDESRPASQKSNSQAASRASSNNERTSLQQDSAASSRAQSAASNASNKEDGKEEEGKEDQEEDNIKASEEMKSSRPVSTFSQKEDSRPGTSESISRHSNSGKNENDKEEVDTGALKEDSSKSDDLSRPGTATSKKSLEDVSNSIEVDDPTKNSQEDEKDEDERNHSTTKDEEEQPNDTQPNDSEKLSRPASRLSDKAEERPISSQPEANEKGKDETVMNDNENGFSEQNPSEDKPDKGKPSEENSNEEKLKSESENPDLTEEKGNIEEEHLSGEGLEGDKNEELAVKAGQEDDDKPLQGSVGDGEESSQTTSNSEGASKRDSEDADNETDLVIDKKISQNDLTAEKSEDLNKNRENEENQGTNIETGGAEAEAESVNKLEVDGNREDAKFVEEPVGDVDKGKGASSEESASSQNETQEASEKIVNKDAGETVGQEAEETGDSVETEANEKGNEVVSSSDKKGGIEVDNDKEEDHEREEVNANEAEEVQEKDLEAGEDKKEDFKDNKPISKEGIDESKNVDDELVNGKDEDRAEKEEDKIENSKENTENKVDENTKDEAKNDSIENRISTEGDENVKDEVTDDKDQDETGKNEDENEKEGDKNEEGDKNISKEVKDYNEENSGDAQGNEAENTTADKSDQVNEKESDKEMSLKGDIGDRSEGTEAAANRPEGNENERSSANVRVDEKRQVDGGEIDEEKQVDGGEIDEKKQVDGGEIDEKKQVDGGEIDEKKQVDGGEIDEENGRLDNITEKDDTREDSTVEGRPEDEVKKGEETTDINNTTIEEDKKVNVEGTSGQDEGVSGENKINETENKDEEKETKDHDEDKIESSVEVSGDISNLSDKKKNEGDKEVNEPAKSQDVKNGEDAKQVDEEDKGNDKKEADETRPAELQDDDDSHRRIAEKETEEEDHETKADVSNSDDTPAITSPILSPTPPKTPRNNSAPRRLSSRLSNPTTSRPNSRSSVNQESIDRKAADIQNADDGAAEDASATRGVENNGPVNDTEAIGNSGESTSLNERAVKEHENGMADEERRSQEGGAEDKSHGIEDRGEKNEDKKESFENSNGLTNHGDDIKETQEGNSNNVEVKGDNEASGDSGKTTLNEENKNE